VDAIRNCSHVRLAYQFIEANKKQYSVEAMCRVLEVAPSGKRRPEAVLKSDFQVV